MSRSEPMALTAFYTELTIIDVVLQFVMSRKSAFSWGSNFCTNCIVGVYFWMVFSFVRSRLWKSKYASTVNDS